jgi:nifR3 family TIM-barrel protein
MLTIAGLAIPSPVVLAPLAGYTDLPFRLLCREYGAGLCVSEMISCHGLCYRQAKTHDMLRSFPAERPVSFQLFGAEADLMAEAAAILSSCNPDLLDINMGCPVKKVTKRGAGAALMADPHLAEKIIRGVVANSQVPVTVKIRAGVNATTLNGEEFARMAESAGAAAVTVHGRTWAQGFTGVSDRSVIARIKQAVKIPVIGNGDVHSCAEAMAMMTETGCDGVMIGRAALGNPWVFTKTGRPDDLAGILAGAARHLDLIEQFLDTDRILGTIKNHIGRYFKHLPGSAEIRKAVYESQSYAALKTALHLLQRMSESGPGR